MPETVAAASSAQTPPAELGYAQITAPFTGNWSVGFTNVTGLSVAVTVGTRGIRVEAFAPLMDDTVLTTGQRLQLELFDTTGAVEVATAYANQPSANGGAAYVVARLTPPAGARTYQVRVHEDVGVNGRLFCSATAPAFIRVSEY